MKNSASFYTSTVEYPQNKQAVMSSDEEVVVKYCNSITINASRKIVWSVLSDINNWSSWHADIKKSKLKGKLKPQTTFVWNSGGVKIHSTLQNVHPENQLEWTGKSLGIKAVHRWVLTENDNSTIVRVEEVMLGFMVKLFKKSLNKKLATSLQLWLNLLKKESENLMY